MGGNTKVLDLTEICEGDLLNEMRLEFDEMLKKIVLTEMKGVMNVKITVLPPQRIDGVPFSSSAVSYAITTKVNKPKGHVYTALLNKDGKPIKTGDSDADVINEELELSIEQNGNQVPFTRTAAKMAANGQ